MKNTRRLLAVLLVLAMVLSCLPLSVLAAKSAPADAAPAASQKAQLGFKSASFRENNSYRYASDESVRAIVVMEGKPAGEATESRAVAKAKLAAQHESLRKSMSKISYTELFEYDSLLNGLAVETAYGNLDAISAMPGVKAVYIANHYDLPRYDIKMESSNEMTGLALAHQFGFTGSGTVIAILDTGMTAGHEAFAVYDGMLEEAAISEADAKAYVSEKGYGKYVSQKIPFSYDYADVDNNAEDSTNGHGPHVSGIAAGYAEAPDGAITFMGSAPDAQLLEMKIFMDDEPGTDSTIYFAALEDAFELGADVINMSIGAQNGFTYDPELENEVYGNMYDILEKAGVVCSLSAGNEYSMAHNASNWAGDGYVQADYADFGTVGSPATYDGNMSIASLENAQYPANILKVGELEIPYYDSDEEGHQFFNAMKGKELNYVDCGFGYPEDFESVDVKGKVALISRGDITFQEKVDNAAAAGAAAALVYNNDAGVIYMSIDPYAIPAASITQEDGLALLALLEGGETKGIRVNSAMKNASDRKATRAAGTTGTLTDTLANGDEVYLYNAAAGVVTSQYAYYEMDDEGYLDYYYQACEDATVSGMTLSTNADADSLIVVKNSNGTYSFYSKPNYDDYGEKYYLYADYEWYYAGMIGEEADGDSIEFALEAVDGGFLLKEMYDEMYLAIIEDEYGDIYLDLAEEVDESCVFSFYKKGGSTPVDPPVDPPVGEGDDFTRADSLVDGTEVIIYNPDSGKALSGEVISTYYKAGVDVTPAGDVITTDNTDIVWKIAAADGGFYIYNDQGKLSSDGTYNSIPYNGSNDIWHLEEADGGVYVVNNADKYLEWGAAHDDFTCYGYSDAYAAAMTMQIFVKGEPIVPPDPPVDPDAPVMSFPEEEAIVDNPEGWLMSDYSCWGVTPSLTLKPTITGVGGDVYSVNYNTKDGYTIYSGTSMAAPNVSGYMAVLLGYLMEAEDLTKVERAAKAEAIAQSTAWVLSDADEYIYSPRKQGTGLVDIVNALSTSAYITEPIQNLFDNADGEFEFTFTVKNDGEAAIEYAVTPVAMYDYPISADWSEEEDGSDIRWYNSLTSDYLSEEDCTIDAPATVTVPAGGTADVTVKITLNDETKAFFDEIFPNGNYIEGYVFLTPDDEYESEIHATYMGFYGDWTKAPVMEQHDWREVVELDTWLQTTPADDEGATYADYGYTYFDVADFEVNTDINLAYALNYSYLEAGQLYGGYAGDNLFAYADSFNEKHIAITEGPDGICDTLYMMPMNIRNCRHMIMVVSNAETGEVYYVDDTEYLPKAIYDEDYGYWSNTGTFMWDGTDADGNVVDNNTVVCIDYYCNLAYGEDELGKIAYEDLKADGADYLEWNFLCTVDNEAPEFTYEYDKAAGTLTVTASDNQYVAYIGLYLGDELVDEAVFSEDEAGKTVSAVFEGLEDGVYELDVADYASNIVADDVIVGDVDTATVKFIVPEGCELDADSDEITVAVGSDLTMPYLYGEVDGGYFVAWLTQPIDGVISSEELDSDEYAWIWDEMYFDGDAAMIDGDITFYPLFERVTEYADPHDELALCTYDQADWSGIWAFNGYDWTAGDYESSDYMLTSDLSAFYLDFDNEEEYIEYGMLGDGYLIGAPDEQLFEIELLDYDEDGYGIYSIKNSEGKYLAITKDGELTLVDSVDDAYATWDIWLDGESYCNIVYNRGDDYVLLFDEETGEFGSVYAEDATIDEPYNLYMFGASALDYEYFTADAAEPQNCPCFDYTDVDRNAWYHPYVDFVIENALMGSTTTDGLTFEPTTSCTRSMIVTILYSLAGKPEVEFEAAFPDVKDNQWYTDPIMWAYQNGVVSGYDNGNFGPNDKITREQMAVVLKAYTEKIVGADTSETADLGGFADAAKVTWSKPYISWAVAEGLLSGKPVGDKINLDPQGNASRVEVAAILYSYINNVLK